MRHPRAFTLIELLVSVAIIALLVAILIPTLSRAREEAKLTKCLSNLKSFGVAGSTYSTENDGYLFPAYWGGWTNNAVSPPVNYSSKSLVGQSTAANADILSEYLFKIAWSSSSDRQTVFTCPSHVVSLTSQYPMTYGANCSAHTYMISDPTSTQYPRFLHKIQHVGRPSMVITMADASQSSGAGTSAGWLDGTDSWSSGVDNSAYNDPKQGNKFLLVDYHSATLSYNTDKGNYHIRYRHRTNRAANVVMLDGHAETAPMGKFDPTQAVANRQPSTLKYANIGIAW